MVNEDRVKQLYKIAIYEQTEEKEHRQAGQYYRSDYIGKEVVKSFFTGSFAYLIMAALWMISNWALVLHQINTLAIIDTAIGMVVIYVLFMVVYILATALIYYYRYKHSKKKVDAYVQNLKVAYSMFEREEKLKK
ncbi:MAG: hypothetical protein IJA07_07720 [Agathobacter sp.]|nr:hypothetical protein [Agathobacter sp.]